MVQSRNEHWTHGLLCRTLDDMTMFNHTTAPVRSYGWLTELRSSMSERRHARAARRVLESELATYRTPADVEDLFAALRTQDDNPTAEDMRTILLATLESHELRTAS
jgi:hypothetical protein